MLWLSSYVLQLNVLTAVNMNLCTIYIRCRCGTQEVDGGRNFLRRAQAAEWDFVLHDTFRAGR